MDRELQEQFETRITALGAERDALREGLEFFMQLVKESEGLAGYPYSGDFTEWSEFGLDDFRALLKEPSEAVNGDPK
jgi:hypothetical protein